jgi:SAM-dependent methyltransferase
MIRTLAASERKELAGQFTWIRGILRTMPRFAIAAPISRGFLDEIEIGPSDRVQLFGWHLGATDLGRIEVLADDQLLHPLETFALSRPDVALSQGAAQFCGFAITYRLEAQRVSSVVVRSEGKIVAVVNHEFAPRAPDYANLFDAQEILGREHVYSVGPPNSSPNDDVLAMASALPPPVLDFGCGSGALVRELRRLQVDAWGIEIKRTAIEESIRDDVRTFITLYDGKLPLPYPDGRFGSVVCSEVLEHIPDYRAAVLEMARLARTALVTVPDMSAVPTLFPHFVVPWHLLESSHCNFFTSRSLRLLLEEAFDSVTMLRIGPFEINGTRAFTSLVARASGEQSESLLVSPLMP